MKVKVCGITNLEDALLAQNEGADALGFIFATISPRQITPESCRKIISELHPFIAKVGVFVDEKIERVVEVANYCGLTAIQLHGKENFHYINELKKSSNCSLIKAFRLSDDASCEIIKSIPENLVSAFLIDGPGGESLKEPVLKKVSTLLPKNKLILAGGLNENNLEGIFNEHKPEAIDLCSSLEKEKGKKDLEKVKSFFQKIKSLK